MICAQIDTDGLRFTVLTVTGYPLVRGRPSGAEKEILSATVYDRFYMREIATYRSADRVPSRGRATGFERGKTCPECGGRKASYRARLCATCAKRLGTSGPRRYGMEGARAAAEVRCAELNAWHEREGWGE